LQGSWQVVASCGKQFRFRPEANVFTYAGFQLNSILFLALMSASLQFAAVMVV